VALTGPSRVLVVRAGALGDVLLLRRAVTSLHAAGHDVDLLAPGAAGSVLAGPGRSEVERLWPWERAELAALMSDGASRRPGLSQAFAAYDAAVAYTRSQALLAGLASLIPNVRSLDPDPPPGGPHASSWYASALGDWGREVDAVPPLRHNDDESAQATALAARLPERFIAIHPGSGSPRKNWPIERYARLVEELTRAEAWLLILGPAEQETATDLEGLPGAMAVRDLPPRILAALLSRAGAFVGNDSGISHLAAAVAAPTFALFGPTDPAIWAPLGPRVQVVRSEDGSMRGITVEAVLKAVASARG
jgi:heptosyltransferase-2